MSLPPLDWKTLDRLREGFLGATGAKDPYWTSLSDLFNYNATYAERIGWKWDAALREASLRGWKPARGLMLDWGCGSGIASRRLLSAFGADHFESLLLWDHSPLAIDFSLQEAARLHPKLNVAAATPGFLAGDTPIGLLVVSHVLNELDEAALTSLSRLILRSEMVFWVEPGTHEIARRLQGVRDSLLERLQPIAPCPHGKACPMLAQGHERHWCHFFAPPPPEIFCNRDWVQFGKRAGIDLRSLPYSFLLLKRRLQTQEETKQQDRSLHRLIGHPEHFKPYARALTCSWAGLQEVQISKSRHKALYKELGKSKDPLFFSWKVEKGELISLL